MGSPNSGPGVLVPVFASVSQDVVDFLHQHDQLCSWDGLHRMVCAMVGIRRCPVVLRDNYGELANMMHRLTVAQQCLVLR